MNHSPIAQAADHSTLLRVTGNVFSLLLLGTLGALVWGHFGGASRGLSLNHSYITEYGFAAYLWLWNARLHLTRVPIQQFQQDCTGNAQATRSSVAGSVAKSIL